MFKLQDFFNYSGFCDFRIAFFNLYLISIHVCCARAKSKI